MAERDASDIPADNAAVRYQGVSVDYLSSLATELLCEKVAEGVNLATLKEDVVNASDGVDIAAGSSVRLLNSSGATKTCATIDGIQVQLDRKILEPKSRVEWTMEDLCSFYVKPLCSADSSFALDKIAEKDVGARFQGAFLSYARSSPVQTLVRSLVSRAKAKSSIQNYFVWIDIFCANQPLLTGQRAQNVSKDLDEMLSQGLHKAIALFDESVVFFDSWLRPTPLRRLWCVWEIYGAYANGRDITLLMAEEEEIAFIQTLQAGYEQVYDVLGGLDMRAARCHNEIDQEQITQAININIPGGFEELNVMMMDELRSWLTKSIEEATQNEEQQSAKSPTQSIYIDWVARCCVYRPFASDARAKYARLMLEAANLYRSMAAFKDAERLYNAAEKSYSELGPSKAAREGLGLTMMHRGTLFDDQNMLNPSLECFDKACEILTEVRGPRSYNVGFVKERMGNAQYRYLNLEPALELFQEARDIMVASYGSENARQIASAYNGIGNVLFNQEKYSRALSAYSKALEIRLAITSSYTPSLGIAYFNISRTFEFMGGHNEQALDAAKQALRIWTRLWSPHHPKTVRAQEQVDKLSSSA